ncbi:DinB family protein [Paenibacillus sp. HJGM_3]|uniref:DinB family protein n=1 Tax=Paenibacillus sp. HJGM_3 TaxID=3379816 RepID=UPI00385F6033
MNERPTKEEYGLYYEQYISLVPEGDIRELLAQALEENTAVWSALSEEKGLFRYASGKWSVKEVLGHLIDGERIMSYRLLRIGRGDPTMLSGFDQDAYVQGAAFDAVPLAQLVEEYTVVRRATLLLLKGLPEEAWSRAGSANNSVLTTRALAYIIAGHERHHMRILKERYLG